MSINSKQDSDSSDASSKENDLRDSSEVGFLAEIDPQDPADAKERKSILLGTAGYIIITEFCERLAYYGTSIRSYCYYID